MTIYGGDQYLINNTQNRYEVGDRSYQLTYPDGGLVYGPNSTNSSTEGPFKVLMQPADVPPPANWTSKYVLLNLQVFSLVVDKVANESIAAGYQVLVVEEICRSSVSLTTARA